MMQQAAFDKRTNIAGDTTSPLFATRSHFFLLCSNKLTRKQLSVTPGALL